MAAIAKRIACPGIFMSHPTEPPVSMLQFYTTAEYPCSYLADHMARSEVAAPAHLIDAQVYSRLIEQGFRRSGLFTYRPKCLQCAACLPIRVDVENFVPSRNQRRVMRQHDDLTARLIPLRWVPEHYQLYYRYQQARHAGAGMDEDTEKQYGQFLLASGVESRLLEFRSPDGTVRMVSLIDLLDHGLSAVYTFFDPDARGSLGTYGVLWQIEQCRRMGLPWLYLGYWIRESRKMSYKSRFWPWQVYRNGQWYQPDSPSDL